MAGGSFYLTFTCRRGLCIVRDDFCGKNYGLYNKDWSSVYLYFSEHLWRAGDHDGAFAALDKAYESCNGHSGNMFSSQVF